MTTRRIVSTATEPTVLDKDDLPPAQGIAGKGNTSPAVSTNTILKLLAFTAAMIIAPIGTYYGTMATIFKQRSVCSTPYLQSLSGNTTLAGACAALAANIVLVVYIVVAIKDDEGEQEQKKKELKKKA